MTGILTIKPQNKYAILFDLSKKPPTFDTNSPQIPIIGF